MALNLTDFQKMEEIDANALNSLAEQKGKAFALDDKINTNQIRNIFGEIIKIRTRYKVDSKYETIRKDLILLKPKLAYAAARQPKKMESFKDTFVKLIDLVENSQDKNTAIKSFFEFSEAIVAYHKYFEEKKR